MNEAAGTVKPFMNKPHVVLLGAGASLAAFPNGEKNGHKLPLMRNLVDVVSLAPLLQKAGVIKYHNDFEKLFSGLVLCGQHSSLLAEIETRLFDYFSALQLPDEPTLYDHLVLSLRDKDVIATFNWDPFLWQAISRCHKQTEGSVNLPRILFLHGNTAIGYTENDEQIFFGQLGKPSQTNEKIFEKGPLLFPIAKKHYSSDRRIKSAWDDLRGALNAAYLFTVFGYSAPESDVEAVTLVQEAWGNRSDRGFEEIELIDIRPEIELQNTWNSFIHTHHFRSSLSFYDSIIASSPRRSCEAIWGELMDRQAIHSCPLPWGGNWSELIYAVKAIHASEALS